MFPEKINSLLDDEEFCLLLQYLEATGLDKVFSCGFNEDKTQYSIVMKPEITSIKNVEEKTLFIVKIIYEDTIQYLFPTVTSNTIFSGIHHRLSLNKNIDSPIINIFETIPDKTIILGYTDNDEFDTTPYWVSKIFDLIYLDMKEKFSNQNPWVMLGTFLYTDQFNLINNPRLSVFMKENFQKEINRINDNIVKSSHMFPNLTLELGILFSQYSVDNLIIPNITDLPLHMIENLLIFNNR